MGSADQGIRQDSPRYQLVPRTLIFLTQGDSVLFLRRSPHKTLWPNRYNGLGGHVEQGETLLAAACREVHEEAGLDSIPALHLRALITVDTLQNPGILLAVFVGDAPSEPVQASGPEGTLHWLPWRSLPKSSLVEDLPQLLPRLFAASSVNRVLYGHYTYDPEGHLQTSFIEP